MMWHDASRRSDATWMIFFMFMGYIIMMHLAFKLLCTGNGNINNDYLDLKLYELRW